MTEENQPAQTPGQKLAQEAHALSVKISEYVIETCEGTIEAQTVMLALAISCRRFLDSLEYGVSMGAVHPEEAAAARETCFKILSVSSLHEIIGVQEGESVN